MKLSELVAKFDSISGKQDLYPSLTADQQKIHDGVLSEYNHRDIRYAVLDAKSGSGKTTTIRAIVKTAKERGISVDVTATTGKAGSALGGVTIHSYLGLKMVQNDKAEEASNALQLKSSDDSHVVIPDILIIDESSMLGMTLIRQVMKHRFNYILFVLDSNQLPPVKEQAVEWKKIVHSEYFLTQTLRATDDDLVRLFEDFKDFKDGKIKDLDLRDYVNNRNIVEIDYADCDFIPANSESCAVSYRNKLVEFMANKVTSRGHKLYNLNNGITITEMEFKGDYDSRNYPIREFVSKQVFFNGEDVKIDILDNVTKQMIQNGYTNYKNFKIGFNKSNSGLVVRENNIKPNEEPKMYYINLPIEEVLEHCSLAMVDDAYFILIWNESEASYKQMIDDLFMQLKPHLDIHNNFKNYLEGKSFNKKLFNQELITLIQDSPIGLLQSNYLQTDTSMDRKKAWSNFMSAKNVVTARYTTSRTIHKAQGISVPCVVLTNNSFYGASLSAQYVAVTRGKHGVILVNNVPNVAKGEEDERISLD